VGELVTREGSALQMSAWMRPRRGVDEELVERGCGQATLLPSPLPDFELLLPEPDDEPLLDESLAELLVDSVLDVVDSFVVDDESVADVFDDDLAPERLSVL
jgi:hypothetical protein